MAGRDNYLTKSGPMGVGYRFFAGAYRFCGFCAFPEKCCRSCPPKRSVHLDTRGAELPFRVPVFRI